MQEGFSLQAVSVSVCRGGRLILDNVSVSAIPGELTAIIGPNGAGKTTLMRSLAGVRPDGGHILINEQEMYQNPESWLQQIGYVPEDSILHGHLALRDALVYVGRLRCPERAPEEIGSIVDDLLSEFGFPEGDKRRQKLINKLSTGERKRANVCSELITDPPILMLDEPTSNLDPHAERDLMARLSDYAHTHGKTVLVITHTLNTIDRYCDKVIFVENSHGRSADRPESVLEALEVEADLKGHATQTSEEEQPSSQFYRWAHVFDHFATDEEMREPCIKLAAPQTRQQGRPRSEQIPFSLWLHQLKCLLSRYTRVRLGDPWNLIGTLLAGCSGLLFFVLPKHTFVKPFDPSEVGLALTYARQSVYVVCLATTLIGLITSYTEISKEFRIYQHERLKGLLPSAYILSKWIWLTLAVGILAPVVLIGLIVLFYRQPLPGFSMPREWAGETVGWLEHLIRFQLVGLVTRKASWLVLTTLVLACIASVTLGLLISAVAGDGSKGYLYLTVVVVFMVLFSGLIRNEKLEDYVDALSFLSTGKWAYEGFASSIEVYCWLDAWRFDEFNSTGHLASVWFALGAYVLVASLLAIVALRVRDPWYRWWINLRRLFASNWTRIAVYLAVLVLLLSYTVFLRVRSHEYHSLNYFNRQEYGGDNAIHYPNVDTLPSIDRLQLWNARLSQTWCSG